MGIWISRGRGCTDPSGWGESAIDVEEDDGVLDWAGCQWRWDGDADCCHGGRMLAQGIDVLAFLSALGEVGVLRGFRVRLVSLAGDIRGPGGDANWLR